MSIDVLTAGLSTSVQDAGRPGWAALGVSSGGAADAYSLQIANLLVGNAAGAAALEISLTGPHLRFNCAARIAITGARIDAECDGQPLPGWHWIDLPAAATLRLGGCRNGARSYLAVRGGVALPPVLGSRATDLRGAFGGFEGRTLRPGDRLPVAPQPVVSGDGLRVGRTWLNPLPDLDFSRTSMLRVLAGHDALIAGTSLHGHTWQVTAQSNRQGIRLQGAQLRPDNPAERISEPVTPGTIQLPPSGQPIILGVDAQTVGGYPRIGHVIRADWPRLAQLLPGDALALQPVDQAQALRAWREQRARLVRMALALETPGARRARA